MTDQPDSSSTAAETEPRPTTYDEASSSRRGREVLDARARFGELTDRHLSARSRAILEARGEYTPEKAAALQHPEPLTVSEHLELLANGEVMARYYRHPSQVDHAARAGATWDQIAAARGQSPQAARREYRAWAEGQHKYAGMDDATYTAAVERAAEYEAEAGQ